MTSDLTDLLARVEAAEGPDRELDALVFLACGLDAAAGSAMSGEGVGGKFRFREGEMLSALVARYPRHIDLAATVCQPPHATASLDAALALCERVLPRWIWTVGPGWAQIEPDVSAFLGDCIEHGATAKTSALALLAAMLKAKIAQTEPIS